MREVLDGNFCDEAIAQAIAEKQKLSDEISQQARNFLKLIAIGY